MQPCGTDGNYPKDSGGKINCGEQFWISSVVFFSRLNSRVTTNDLPLTSDGKRSEWQGPDPAFGKGSEQTVQMKLITLKFVASQQKKSFSQTTE